MGDCFLLGRRSSQAHAWEYHGGGAEPVRLTGTLHAGKTSVGLDELLAGLPAAA